MFCLMFYKIKSLFLNLHIQQMLGTQERREVIALEMENNFKLHFKPK